MAQARSIVPAIPARIEVLGVDGIVAALAAAQHGVVARFQLLELGLTRHAVAHRVSQGRLHPLYPGVYAVGHKSVSRHGRWMAAVLACGRYAVLSHQSAAALWAIRATARTTIDITVPTRHAHRGVHIHRGERPLDELTVVDGIPTTTVPRTLFDLAAVLEPHQVEGAINEAEFQRLTDPLSLADMLAGYPRLRGAGTIRAILQAGRIGKTRTRSELEERFIPFLDRHGLPRPETNAHVPIGDRLIECDCVWREARLIVELDGRAAHETTRAFEEDRARDRPLIAAGWRVIRITWRQLHGDPHGIATDLMATLGTGRYRRRMVR